MNMQEKAKMTRSARDHIQAALATGQLTLDQWDARRTEDGQVSVVDVIADVTGKTAHYASNVYRDLVREERVSECEVRPLPPRSSSLASWIPGSRRIHRGGARVGRETAVATVVEPCM